MSTPETVNELPSIIIRIPLVLEIPITVRTAGAIDLDKVELRLEEEPQTPTGFEEPKPRAQVRSSVRTADPAGTGDGIRNRRPWGSVRYSIDGQGCYPLADAANKVGADCNRVRAAARRNGQCNGHAIREVPSGESTATEDD